MINTNTTLKNSVKVIGIGGCGINVVNHMIENNLYDIDFVAIDSDHQNLESSLASHKIALKRTNQSVQYHEAFNQIISKDSQIFVIVGLGGSTNATVVPIFVILAIIKAANITFLATTPFAFEGETKMRLSSKLAAEIETSQFPLKCFPNEKILQDVTNNFGIKESFTLVDASISQTIVESISYTGIA